MILQKRLPYDAFQTRPLPTIQTLDFGDWLHVDECYAAQMAERARILDQHRGDVLRLQPGSEDACAEALELVVTHLPAGFARNGAGLTCPDGRVVDLTSASPLEVLSQIVQEDMVIMQKQGDEHVLTAACLCFPASWQLAEKFGRPMIGIHARVDEYTDRLARVVQRLFNAMQTDRPFWRFNALWYMDPTLYQPRSASAPRPATDPGSAPYFRSERQSLVYLPRSGATLFSIHTYVLARADALAHQKTAQAEGA